MMAGHQNLASGTKFHSRCDECVETLPAIRFHLDEERQLEAIDRHITCSSFSRNNPLVVQFSVGLMAYHSPSKDVVDVIRTCSAHENFHYHVGDYLRPKKKLPARGIRVLNSAEDSHEAYYEACSYIISEAFERWREWHPRK
ncbi:hypothetical protein [Rothia nasimurium]|uniref:hypothetical protein n=1 Tax=Rothia nasimurium TaxID=85336 RepID=UPI001F423C53|nr:hypothetical protein [Rothia nasimurium]